MLSAHQNALIDALPNEGGLYFFSKGEKVHYPAHAARECALLPLQGKEPSANKRVILLHGAPGSGKTYNGMQRLELLMAAQPDLAKTMAVISYDEFGAMYDIQEYLAGLMQISGGPAHQQAKVSPDTLFERRKLWQDFQPLSQFIRSKTLKCALAEEHDLYIDVTSSGPGAIALIQVLQALDYGDVEMWSYGAPFGISSERIEQRPRTTSLEDLLLKRVGAYEMLPKFLHYVDTLRIFANESDADPAVEIAHFEAGILRRGNPLLTEAFLSRLADDGEDFIAAAYGLPPSINIDQLQQKYKQALAANHELLLPVLQSLQPRPNRHLV